MVPAASVAVLLGQPWSFSSALWLARVCGRARTAPSIQLTLFVGGLEFPVTLAYTTEITFGLKGG